MKSRILWVDNDPMPIQSLADYLRDAGHEVELATTAAQSLTASSTKAFDLVLLDIWMPHGHELDAAETRGGALTGLTLAKRIRTLLPEAKLVGVSLFFDHTAKAWFEDFGHGYWQKNDIHPGRQLLRRVNTVLGLEERLPRIFIVHGHSTEEKLALKNLLQNRLGLGEPLVLHEQPSAGRTIIEKLEDIVSENILVFILLTPDDPISPTPSTDTERRQSRQNVIFELGFFYGILGRLSGRVLLLYKGGSPHV